MPDRLQRNYSINDVSIRPFGLLLEDLAVNFNRSFRPYIVTQILECCIRNVDVEKVNQNFFWGLTIGKRIECLLAITALGNSSGLSISLRCSNDACQEMMEVDISRKEITDLQFTADKSDSYMIKTGDKDLEIRMPTGKDLIRWLEIPFLNEDAAIREMIRTLLQENRETSSDAKTDITDEIVKVIDEFMNEVDPLVNFTLSVKCPSCEKDSLYEIDLEELSLNKLKIAQEKLFWDIHSLALHYHWSEKEIFSIPSWRRLYYLSLIEKRRPDEGLFS